ncbi:MAG TPA: aldo/keto reductase [Oligoflexus sp.]|uniref:aldo/keto reductase n=1 Tax=Oligoflexus sp. TaxID=1971216 RepID=UPI002D47EA61|nr:aldo/keto reductase [Oligoflexus sp.]HYX33174.1 aldo/keto reductase [Oligoflexus sp.]
MQRREFLEFIALSAASAVLASRPYHAVIAQEQPITKKIPSTGAALPVIGMGTWITFNVGTSEKLRSSRTDITREFFHRGGGLIDSSPMYGSSEAVVGHALSNLNFPKTLFSATKVWTSSEKEGREQIQESRKLWKVNVFDLLQVHNLEGWEGHLRTLFKMKEKGELRYVGVTTSHGRRHDEVEKIMRQQPLDFIQITYNMRDRAVEGRLLGLAQDRGIAVIANRPLDGGDLTRRLEGKPLPSWARDVDCQNWAQFLLKWVVSHPAITCAIPATSKIEHMRENMGASRGRMPDAAVREKMIKHLASL